MKTYQSTTRQEVLYINKNSVQLATDQGIPLAITNLQIAPDSPHYIFVQGKDYAYKARYLTRLIINAGIEALNQATKSDFA